MSLQIGQGISLGQGVKVEPLLEIVTDGLQLYLDAKSYTGTGPTWTSNVGNDATLIASPAYTAANPTYFDFIPADAQYATVPAISSLSQWSVEAWFRPTDYLNAAGPNGLTSVVTTVYKEPNEPDVGAINFCLTNYDGNSSSNDIRVGFFNGYYPEGGWHLTSGLNMTPGTWYSVVGTYNSGALTQYNNGENHYDTVNVNQPSGSGGGNIRLARRWDGETNDAKWLFPGDIAIIRIYNRALTPEEVAQNFEATRNRFGL